MENPGQMDCCIDCGFEKEMTFFEVAATVAPNCDREFNTTKDSSAGGSIVLKDKCLLLVHNSTAFTPEQNRVEAWCNGLKAKS